MKLKLICAALALAATPALAAMGTTEIPTFAGQAAAKEAAKTAMPKNPEEWMQRMTDFSNNLIELKDPRYFVPWANAITEPSFYVAMMNTMMEPGAWLNMMNSAAHPDALRNLLQLGDPNVYLKWGAAGVDPNFYIALLTQLGDPNKLIRWGLSPADPKLLNTLLSTLNPNTYIRWGMAGLDPRAWNLAATMANPALYTSMLGAIVNPYGYGQGASTWLTWKPVAPIQGANSFSMWDPVAMLGNLSGFIPGLNLAGLPELPNIGLPTITLPTLPVPAISAPAYVPPAAPAKPAVAHVPEVKPAAVEAKPAAVEAKPAAVEVKPAEPAVPAAVPAQAAKPIEAAVSVVAPPAVVVLSGDALFLSGKSGIRDLSREGRQRLDEVVAKIKETVNVEQVKVVGHADPTGNAQINQKLSEARAKSIKSYLIAKGIKPAVIVTSGLGDTQPVVQCDAKLASEELKACHAPNRRVEIEIAGKAK